MTQNAGRAMDLHNGVATREQTSVAALVLWRASSERLSCLRAIQQGLCSDGAACFGQHCWDLTTRNPTHLNAKSSTAVAC